MLTRRNFLLGLLGIGAATAVGCTPREHLPSDLAALVNEIGIECMKRQKAEYEIRQKDPYSSAFPLVTNYIGSDWRHLALENILYGMRDSRELQARIHYFRKQREKQVEAIKAQSPLIINGFNIVDDPERSDFFKGRIWGAGDELSIHIQEGDKYQDTFKFLVQHHMREPVVGDTESYSRSSVVAFISKKQNIVKIKDAYRVSEAEAKAKLEGWLPKVLATAHKLYVPPLYFPQESWLPDNNLVRRKVSDYMYLANGK